MKKKHIRLKRYLYWTLNITGNILLCAGLPALSILVVTPLVAHLLPVAVAVALPAMCLGLLGYVVKASTAKFNEILKDKWVPKETKDMPKQSMSTQTNEKKNWFQRIWNPDKEITPTPQFREASTQKDEIIPDLIKFNENDINNIDVNQMNYDNGADDNIGGMGWL